MGRIRDKHEKNKRKDRDSNPLDKFGNTDQETNEFDIDKDTIKDQQKKE